MPEDARASPAARAAAASAGGADHAGSTDRADGSDGSDGSGGSGGSNRAAGADRAGSVDRTGGVSGADHALLRVAGLNGGHGHLQALWDVNLRVGAHETVVLIGPNGAGKTTLIQTLLGLLPQWSGKIWLDGRPITRLRTDRRIRAGIAYMSEIGCFLDLSVQDNLLVGSQFLPAAEARSQLARLYEQFPILREKRHAAGSSLSGGQRKILGVAKALAGHPALLIMDEPSAGLSPLLVKEVVQVLQQFRDTGLALLVAEQNVKFLELADRVYTLEGGRVGFEGSVTQMHADAALERAYFGLRAR